MQANYSDIGDLDTLDLIGLFKDAGLYLKPTGEAGKHWVTCPWQHEHGRTDKTDTVIWQNGQQWPTFHCSHAHCEGRDIHTVIEHFGHAEIDRHCARSFERRRPSGKKYAATNGKTEDSSMHTDE